MKASKYFFKTYKEVPKEAQTPSHILMHRAGMIQKLSSGIYSYLPLALRSLKKIEAIVREELDRCGCLEVLMPTVLPRELWEESGRWKFYGPELLRLKDRKGADYCLGPTHEEVITDMVRKTLTSYKQLPLNLYQIQTKFRDEIRPRFGLMRGREFIMKDAYSFDINEEESKKNYQLMYEAYVSIFEKCGLVFKAVDAATGAIGGDMSHEFQVLAETGEDEILSCSKCKYCANSEKAVSGTVLKQQKADVACESSAGDTAVKSLKDIYTPNQRTIEEISTFLNLSPDKIIKTIVYLVDEKPVVILVPGNKDVNEAKIQSFLGASFIELADDETLKHIAGADAGSVGPIKLKEKVPIIADYAIFRDTGYACGANKTDYHFIDIDPGQDLTFEEVVKADITFAQEGDSCPADRCDGTLEKYRGIEVGQVFFLGNKYSNAMNCSFLDKNGKTQTAVMGCYGIGISRTMAAAIEQNHDEYGIIWPAAIAPFEVAVIPIQGADEAVVGAAEKIYSELSALGIDVFIDDRNERAGVKFNDADLIGFPVQIICGSRLVGEGKVEIKVRKTGEKTEIEISKAVALVKEMLVKL